MNKRRKIMDHYRRKCHVLCIQETHSSVQDENLWTSEWGGQAYYSHGEKNARGVAVFIKKGYQVKVEEVLPGADGRSLSCILEVNDSRLVLVNLYAPNKDSPAFFEEKIRSAHQKGHQVLIIGDYNTTLNDQIDRKGDNRCSNNDNSTRRISQLCEEYMLQDIWRVRNPDQVRYSWYRTIKNTNQAHGKRYQIQASRIDYGLLSAGLSDRVHNCMYLDGVGTDHSAFFVGIEMQYTDRGPSFWKFNTSLLTSRQFVTDMNAHIMSTCESTVGLCPHDRWEFLKKEIKRKSVEISKQASQDDRVAISQLSEQVIMLEDRLHQLDEKELDLLERSKEDLNSLLDKRVCGVMFRSRARWAMEGERSTKYFYNLEKSKYSAKTCTCLIDEGRSVTNAAEILELQRRFYQDLYTRDETVKFSLTNMVENPVDVQSDAAKEQPFSKEEIRQAVKKLKNGSCPGSDGIPIEVYKVFWKQIEDVFMDNIQYTYEHGTSPTAGQGILNVIPKKGKDPRMLKNLRPITVLNVDYKVMEKAISNRMTPALCEIIHEDQKGFLPKRRISKNIRKTLDLVMALEDEPGIIVSCDFMKCFDRISIESVVEAMKYFQFSTTLQKWVKTLYEGFSLKVQNNGHFSSKIHVSRGIHQGGPASNALFLVVVELLAIAIRKDEGIEGISIREVLHLLNQFADDMDVATKGTEENLQKVLEHFEKFGKSTGFKLSYEKTTVYRIGSLRKTSAKFYTESEMSWTSDGINVLGVEIHHNKDELISRNYQPILNKIDAILNEWGKRSLSLCGKIEVINTLVASLFVYKMYVIPPLPNWMVDVLHDKIEKYIWNGSRPKISLQTLQSPKTDGGLQLVNFQVKDAAIKTSWVKEIVRNDYPVGQVYAELNPQLREWIWSCNIHMKHVSRPLIECQNGFWADILRAWAKLHYEKDPDRTQIIWLNSDITVKSQPIWWPMCFQRGLLFTNQLFDGCQWKSPEELTAQFDLSTMQINCLKSAIKKTQKDAAKRDEEFHDPIFRDYMRHEGAPKYVYSKIIPSPKNVCEKELKWDQEFEFQEQMDIPQQVVNIGCVTHIAKFKSFQYRLLHRAIITNVHMKRWKKLEDDGCTHCRTKEPETIKHLLFECSIAKTLLGEVAKIAQEMCGDSVSIDYYKVICNEISDSDCAAVNFMCLICKQYIYRQRCLKEKPNAVSLRTEIRKYRNIEKYYAVKENSIRKYMHRWREPGHEDNEVLSQLRQLEPNSQ